jgi:hypothetical protein
VVDNDYGGVDGARSQCSRRPAPTGTPQESHDLANKDCPAGQTVLIDTGGFGDHWYFWRDSASTSLQRIKNPQVYLIDIERVVDTGMNSIVDVSIEAYRNSDFPAAEDYINSWRTWCSDSLNAHRQH